MDLVSLVQVTRALLDKGVKFDEVIVFIDMSDAQDEAAFYSDKEATGVVNGPKQIVHNGGWYANLRLYITQHLLLTNAVVGFLERESVKPGFYRLNVGHGPLFDLERSAWTYRPVSDTEPYEIGYAPLGLQAEPREGRIQDDPALARAPKAEHPAQCGRLSLARAGRP